MNQGFDQPMNADHWIGKFGMQAHPEGGYFAEVFRSEDDIPERGLPERYSGPRSVATSIYFLLAPGQHSKWHRLKTEELWHFYAGGSMTIYILREGQVERLRIGPEGPFLAHVPALVWFAARPDRPEDFSLAGCTMAPGFDFTDFELGNGQDLVSICPGEVDLIRSLG